MGLMDKVKEQAAQQQAEKKAEQAQQVSAAAAVKTAAAQVTAACPGDHFLTEVNKGSIRMQTWQTHLNEMYVRGYRLAHVFEQDGNTVQVHEHHFH